MTGPDRTADIERARELLVEIIGRKRANGSAQAQLAKAANARPTQASAGAPGGTPKYTDGPAAWQDFVTNYLPSWAGDDASWDRYKQWVVLFAKDRGVLPWAQAFLEAADAATSKVAFFAKQGVPLWEPPDSKKDKENKNKDETNTPEKDKKGNDVEIVLSTKKDSDTVGDFYWVRMSGGKAGKLYVDTLEFVEVADRDLPDKLRRLPTADYRGRPISKIKSEIRGDKRQVLIEGMWGLLDDDGRFTAMGPDDDAYSDWSNRVLVSDGYVENGVLIKGTWLKWKGKDIYLFEPQHNKENVEYARGKDRPKTSPAAEDTKAAGGKDRILRGPVQKALAEVAKPYDGPP
jgi:hypothetical protein